jgi:hypothetical protein
MRLEPPKQEHGIAGGDKVLTPKLNKIGAFDGQLQCLLISVSASNMLMWFAFSNAYERKN